MDPVWPPIELTFNGGPAPSIGLLRAQVSAKLWPGVTTKSIALYKFDSSAVKWTEIVTTAKKCENIFGPPSSIKEGDLICAYEIESATGAVSSSALLSAQSKKAPVISRPEDKYLKLQKKAEATQKKGQGALLMAKTSTYAAGTGTGGSGKVLTAAERAAQQKKRKQVVEIALTLGGDLDFSDDDSNDDDN